MFSLFGSFTDSAVLWLRTRALHQRRGRIWQNLALPFAGHGAGAVHNHHNDGRVTQIDSSAR